MGTTLKKMSATRTDQNDAPAWQYAMHDIFGLVSTLEAVADSCTRNDDPRMQRQGARLTRCTQRLLKICTDATNRDIDDDWVPTKSLEELLEDAAQFARDHAQPGTKVFVSGKVSSILPDNSDTLFRVIYNLTVNAVKAVNACGGGKVEIAAQVVDGVLIVDVTDSGNGVTSATKRVSSQRKRPGMGLHISELLAEAIGGSLNLVRSDANGTTVRLFYELSDCL